MVIVIAVPSLSLSLSLSLTHSLSLALPIPTHKCSIYATRSGNTVLFHHEGGVEVGDVDAKANKVKVDIEDSLSAELAAELVSKVPQEKQK